MVARKNWFCFSYAMEFGVSPPECFGIVEPLVYRSSTFTPDNFSFIQQLNLKTIVHLSPDITQRAVSEFFQQNGIELIHLGMKSWKPSGWQISEELVKNALEIILNEKYHPVLITCTSGVHQTGTVVGCLRRLQEWSFANTLEELRIYSSKARTRYVNETFVEYFDPDLVTLPINLPTWFRVQQLWLEKDREQLKILNQELEKSNIPHNVSSNGSLDAHGDEKRNVEADANISTDKQQLHVGKNQDDFDPMYKLHYFNDDPGPLVASFVCKSKDDHVDKNKDR
mmetsp:Transcript_5360/g.6765  ORF Transcript_5360/g.6765 Transcript_5360/m.6765 type:complete len:283 (+) Transcript_5360:52-900(+)